MIIGSPVRVCTSRSQGGRRYETRGRASLEERILTFDLAPAPRGASLEAAPLSPPASGHPPPRQPDTPSHPADGRTVPRSCPQKMSTTVCLMLCVLQHRKKRALGTSTGSAVTGNLRERRVCTRALTPHAAARGSLIHAPSPHD